MIKSFTELRLGLLVLFCFLQSCIMAQISVSGTITQEDNAETLIGVSVIVKGTSTGTVTNLDGKYNIEVADASSVLEFSYVGFVTKEITVGNQTTIDVQMSIDAQNLEEVVVVGYGSRKVTDLTGAVGTISSDRLEAKPNANIQQALQGAVPGLNITQNGASAEGGENSILIRGRNSITAGNGPLIVLDGVPYAGNLSDINPNDVGSITVLKDASSTAIYGSRGANGVIIVETKKGKAGKVRVSYSGYYGIQQMANVPEVYDGPGFAEFKRTHLTNDGFAPDNLLTPSEEAVLEAGEAVDWLDLTTQLGRRQEHNVSVSGGTKDLNYYTSLGFHDSEGVTINDKFQRISLRVNLSFNITENIEFGTATQLSRIDRSGNTPSFSSQRDGLLRFNPLTTAFDEQGNPTIYPWEEDVFVWNPLGRTLEINDDINTKVFTNNFIKINFPFLEGLSYKLNTGVEYDERTIGNYEGRNTPSGFENGGVAETDLRKGENYLVENILDYTRVFGNHTVGFTGLYSTQVTRNFDSETSARGFVSDALTYYQMSNSTSGAANDTDFRKTQLLSQMGRLNYGFMDKYLLTVTVRRDGFSGFGADNKYGVFPSVALGWNLSNESFFNIEPINYAKLRVSYGSNGNQAVGAYDNLARLNSRPYLIGESTAPGFFTGPLANASLGWEMTTTLNAGIDLGFLENRFQLSADFYLARTEDLLLDRLIPSVNGVDRVVQNIGETENIGLEIVAQGYVINKADFKWRFKGNAAWNQNRIVSLFGDGQDDLANQWFIGQPIRVNYGYQFDGIWQEGEDPSNSAQPGAIPGSVKVLDVANGTNDSGEPLIQIDPDNDRVLQGQEDPKLIYGIENTFSYGNLSLYVFLQGVTGVTKRNPWKNTSFASDIRGNWFAQEFWTPENPRNDFFINHPDANPFGVNFYEDASFLRLRDVTLSYTFENDLFGGTGLNGVQVYSTVRNLLTFTSYGALDPELDNQLDTPLQREFVFGLKFNL